MRSRIVSAAATNQSRSVATDASLPRSSASLASTALLISSISSSSAGAPARHIASSPTSLWSAVAGGHLRAKLALSMPHASYAAIGAWPAGGESLSRPKTKADSGNLEPCAPDCTEEVERARAAKSVCSLSRAPRACPGRVLYRRKSGRPDWRRGRGGEGVACAIYLCACPLPNPPAEVGCFRLRPINKAAELG